MDLLPHKVCITDLFLLLSLANFQKEMNNYILQRYYKLLDEKDNPPAETKKDDDAKAKKEREYQDHLLAQRLLRSENNRPITRRGATPSKVVKKKTLKKTGRTPNTAFNQELVLSPQLQEVVKSERLSRPQVVKQMWAYIKSNNLQDPLDKRKIHRDEKLKNVFKKLLVGMFEMNKILGDHFYKDGELLNGHSTKQELNDDDDDSDEEEEQDNDTKPPPPSLKREVVSDDESEISDVDD